MTSAITDPDYKQWVSDIEKRFKKQQLKAAIHVNSDKLEFYWSLGRDICEREFESKHGSSAIQILSKDLRVALPGVAGLTPGSSYYCKRFYKLYSQIFKKFPQAGEISKPLHSVPTETQTMPLNIFSIPWGHHKVIIDYLEDAPEKAIFYASKILENCWSRATLLNMIGDKGKNNGLYERQGKAVNNFPQTMPHPTGDLARELINDPLNFSFLKLKESFDEENLKNALVQHVNNLFAQYCLEGYNQPIAITAYEGIQILPNNFNEKLPSINELEEEIRKK